jgi:hypothetical protein
MPYPRGDEVYVIAGGLFDASYERLVGDDDDRIVAREGFKGRGGGDGGRDGDGDGELPALLSPSVWLHWTAQGGPPAGNAAAAKSQSDLRASAAARDDEGGSDAEREAAGPVVPWLPAEAAEHHAALDASRRAGALGVFEPLPPAGGAPAAAPEDASASDAAASSAAASSAAGGGGGRVRRHRGSVGAANMNGAPLPTDVRGGADDGNLSDYDSSASGSPVHVTVPRSRRNSASGSRIDRSGASTPNARRSRAQRTEVSPGATPPTGARSLDPGGAGGDT